MELSFRTIAVKGDKGYASDFERNGLFEVDIKTGECKFLGTFPNEDINITRLHGCARWIKNKIYFIPSAGKNISVYNIVTKEIETIEIPRTGRKNSFYKRQLKFTGALEYGGFLWLIPATYPGIIKLNPDTYEVIVIDRCVPDEGYMFRRGICVRGHIFYAASGNNNIVLVFDMDSENGKAVHVGSGNNGVMDMCECGEDFIMAPRKHGSIVRWNPVTNRIVEYKDYPDGFEPGEIVFTHIYEFGTQVIFVPAGAGCGIRLSEHKILSDREIRWKQERSSMVDFMFENDSDRYFTEINADSPYRFYKISKKSNRISPCHFNISNTDERREQFVKSASANNEIIEESSSMGLQDWIKAVL